MSKEGLWAIPSTESGPQPLLVTYNLSSLALTPGEPTPYVCMYVSMVCGKGPLDLLQCQKRPTTASKETCYSVKRDLLQCQKRPTTASKETYYSVKRDLLQCQKRPITTWDVTQAMTTKRFALNYRLFCNNLSPDEMGLGERTNSRRKPVVHSSLGDSTSELEVPSQPRPESR